ncbi:resistance-nodulation-cell division (RND) efflux membrane fusion protein [Thiosulfatimonas sediminis]|uniref:Resistance-nodulation-cell division (RND) efflux membrane fusion protein n=1 Tax=Thiosulfatimonas sediminis TaxID=2675054 RepID=A0A6F8PYP5_9GAMM|nr:resistance-nodulation-cell division (RND) efflux membrane fusion protein [Thiosulfatimonas sediminis]
MRVGRASFTAILWVLLFSSALSGCQQEPERPEKSLLKVKVVTVVSSAQSRDWVLNGTLSARKIIPLGLRVAGQVKQVSVDLGSRVDAGQTLLQLDQRDFVLSVKSSQAAIKVTAAQISQTQSDLQRVEALQQRKLASEQAKQQLETQLKALQAQQNANHQNLQQAQNQLDYTQLVAVNAGVIGSRMVEEGQVVNAGQALFQLIVDGQRDVALSVPEARIGDLPDSALATINGQSYPVKLRTRLLQADLPSRTWTVYYQLADSALINRMPLNQSVRVQFTQALSNQVQLPLSALYEAADYPSVWLLENGKAKRLAVEILRLSSESVWLRADFPANAKVIALGVHLLSEGQPLEEMP